MPDLNLNWKNVGVDLLWSLLGISMNLTMPIFNRIDVYYKIHDVNSRFDKKIPLKVPFIIPYFAYFPYLVLGWAYIALFEYDIAVKFILSIGIIGLVAGFITLLFPTFAPRAYVYGGGPQSRLLRWHYGLNRPLSAFPSLHVGHSAIISLYLIVAVPSLTVLWVFIAAAIAISTLFTKEHYILDVIGGLALSVGVFYLMNAL